MELVLVFIVFLLILGDCAFGSKENEEKNKQLIIRKLDSRHTKFKAQIMLQRQKYYVDEALRDLELTYIHHKEDFLNTASFFLRGKYFGTVVVTVYGWFPPDGFMDVVKKLDKYAINKPLPITTNTTSTNSNTTPQPVQDSSFSFEEPAKKSPPMNRFNEPNKLDEDDFLPFS